MDPDFDVVVIGGGVSGLAAAFELRRSRPDLSLAVLEKETSAGGKVRSSSEEGFTFDWGPNGFVPSDATFDLIAALGIEDELVPASPQARARFIYRDGGLRRVPTSPPQLLRSELLSPIGKARAAIEPLLPRPRGEDESVYDFARRRFGREAAELAATMVLGITAGDARKVSLPALFPFVGKLEREHGSVLRGLIASRRRSSRQGGGEQGAPPDKARPRAPSWSFRGGMGALTRALAGELGGAVRPGVTVTGLRRAANGLFSVELAGGEKVLARRVALCTPAHVSARLLEDSVPAAAHALAAIPYPDVDVFALGFDRIAVPNTLDGFGFLVPRGQGVRSLGVLWCSSLYPGRAPEGSVLLRAIAGGAVDPQFTDLSDEEARAAVLRDLRLTMGITAQPRFERRITVRRAIPQYELGHSERVGQALRASREAGGPVLGGNALLGVSVNDCVRDARRVADELLYGVSEPAGNGHGTGRRGGAGPERLHDHP